MRRNLFINNLVLLLVLVISGVNLAYSADKCSDKHVIILSMDGFRWDYTLDAHTPTLDSVRRVGSYAQMKPVFPANTFPSHYSMATGLHPNNHGVTNNKFYDDVQGRFLSVFEKDDCLLDGFWGGEPIWNTVELQGGISHIYMWPGSEYPINDRQATVWTKYDHHLDYYKRADQVIKSMSLPQDQVPNLVMWYMPDPDEVGHHTGPNSKECIAKVEYIDQVLAYFFAKLRETPYFEDTNVIITADHGMAQLSADKYVNLYNTIDPSKVKYHISGSPFFFEVEEGYVDQAVEKLNTVGHLRAYRSDEIPAKYHYGSHPTRITNIVIIPDMGWKLDFAEKDSKAPAGGSHGYDPFESDMQVVFFGAGPNFKRGYSQDSFQNQNIYTILCHLLGITPAKNDGNLDDVSGMFIK